MYQSSRESMCNINELGYSSHNYIYNKTAGVIFYIKAEFQFLIQFYFLCPLSLEMSPFQQYFSY